jgi:hypothetical protein
LSECIVQQPLPYRTRRHYWSYKKTILLQHVRFEVDKLQKEMIELGYPVKNLTWEWDNRPGDYCRGIVVKGYAAEVSLWDCPCHACYRLRVQAREMLEEVEYGEYRWD